MFGPEDERHTIMYRSPEGWRYFFYGDDRTMTIDPGNELLTPYSTGTLLMVGTDAEILGIGVLQMH